MTADRKLETLFVGVWLKLSEYSSLTPMDGRMSKFFAGRPVSGTGIGTTGSGPDGMVGGGGVRGSMTIGAGAAGDGGTIGAWPAAIPGASGSSVTSDAAAILNLNFSSSPSRLPGPDLRLDQSLVRRVRIGYVVLELVLQAPQTDPKQPGGLGAVG